MKGEQILLSLRNLRRRKLRSWLTILGIIIGIATIVALISISQGMENAIEEQFANMGISNVRIVPANLRGPPVGDLGLTTADADFVESIVGVEYVDPVLLQYGNVEFAGGEQYLTIVGYDASLGEKAFVDVDVNVAEGRLFSRGDKDVVIVGYDIAHDEDYFSREMRVKNNIEINGEKFRVVGVFENTGTDIDDRIYMPMESARILFDQPIIVNVLTVKILDGVDVEKAAEHITRKLKRYHNGNEDFVVYTPIQLVNEFNAILGMVNIVLVGIAAISLIVGGLGVMNTMFTSVLERTREIGIMKAIGARNGDVLFLFLIESGYIGLVGAFIGAILGTLGAYLVEWIARLWDFYLLSIHVEPTLILFSLLFGFVIGVVSGVLPALRAARLNPVDALRYE